MELKTIFNQFPQKYTKCVCGIRYPKIETAQNIYLPISVYDSQGYKGEPCVKKTNKPGSLLLMSDIGPVSMESSLCDLQIYALFSHIFLPFDSFGQ